VQHRPVRPLPPDLPARARRAHRQLRRSEELANHLAYVGDATVGARVNIGAGTIVANYDGANKHRTIIEDDVHTGSNSVLVAPITIGAGATVGAGSTVTKAVPAGKLTIARAKQQTIEGWKRPLKQSKEPGS
jgi:bifunctional UDP-N-acetylglucosamine pyrophosphorylase/glucosamine-1-phosphate N-acetyltransferase